MGEIIDNDKVILESRIAQDGTCPQIIVNNSKVHDRETKSIKFNGARIITCEFADRKVIMNQGGNKNIVKLKGGRKNSMTGMRDVNRRTIVDSVESWSGKGSRGKEVTIIDGHVRSGP